MHSSAMSGGQAYVIMSPFPWGICTLMWFNGPTLSQPPSVQHYYTAHLWAEHTDIQTTLCATTVAIGHIYALRARDVAQYETRNVQTKNAHNTPQRHTDVTLLSLMYCAQACDILPPLIIINEEFLAHYKMFINICSSQQTRINSRYYVILIFSSCNNNG